MKDLRFGVIGWGYWGPKIARNLDSVPDAMVSMVADRDAYRLASFTNQSKIQVTTQAEEVFRSDVEGVVIATPVGTHYRLAKAALLHGKHVLVEKPLTTNVAEAEELVALAQELGRVLMVGHTFEYSPAVNQLRTLIQSGDLDLGFADGMTAHIHVSWLHPCKIRRVTVIGDARMAVYDDTNPAEMLKVYSKGADVHADPVVSYRHGEIIIPYIDWIEPLRLECEDFANAIRQGIQPRAHGGVGLSVVQVLSAAQNELEKQRKLEVTAKVIGTNIL